MESRVNAFNFYLTRPGAAIFTAGCNEQEFLLNPEKIFANIRAVVYEKNVKSA